MRGHSGNGCDLVSTLCKYDLRKGDLFVLSWARVQRVRQGKEEEFNRTSTHLLDGYISANQIFFLHS